MKMTTRWLIAGTVALVSMAGTLAWAIAPQNPAGGSIAESIIAPSGGCPSKSTTGASIRGSFGQPVVGFSLAPDGRSLYHGVYSPVSSVFTGEAQ